MINNPETNLASSLDPFELMREQIKLNSGGCCGPHNKIKLLELKVVRFNEDHNLIFTYELQENNEYRLTAVSCESIPR